MDWPNSIHNVEFIKKKKTKKTQTKSLYQAKEYNIILSLHAFRNINHSCENYMDKQKHTSLRS